MDCFGFEGFEGFEDGWLGRGVFLSTYARIISCDELGEGCLKQASSWRLNITMPSRRASHLPVSWRRIPETCIPSL